MEDTAATETWTADELRRVAKRQKQVLWMILIQFAAIPATAIFPFAMLIAAIITVYFMWELARALRSSVAWLYALLACIPVISLLTLIYLNRQAKRTLRENGIGVGFMGASSADLEELERSQSPPAARRQD